MLRKTLLVKRTLKMSSDQGEAPLGPCCQVPGFPGCQGESPAGFLVVRALGSLEKTMRSQKGGDGYQEAQIKSS